MGAGRMVKYQPPSKKDLTYPCILYEQSNGKTRFANNYPYTFEKKYTLTLIDPDPDSVYVEILATSFQKIVMDRAYIADNLNHYVFTLYW